MNLASGDHPERLLWFAGGRLDRVNMAAVERHLRSCEACRAEVASLRSMFRSIRDEAAAEHVTSARLVAFHGGDSSISSVERRFIEEHLAGCLACAEDLVILERADVAARPQGLGRPAMAAAASLLLVAVAAGWELSSRNDPASHAPVAQHIVFAPAQRGLDAVPRLTGSGPWEFEVLLPVRAVAASTYVARIHRADDPGAAIYEGRFVRAADGGALVVLVPDLLRPGHHVMSLTPVGGDGSESYLNAFDVAGSP